jgi:predicted ATPase
LIQRAEALGEPPEDPMLLFAVLYGFWAVSFMAFRADSIGELAAQFLALADKQGATGPRMIGHRIMAPSLLFSGHIAESRSHLDQAIALYDRAEHRPLATRFGQDVRVSSLFYRSWALWMLGYPQAALADAEQMLGDARELGQAGSLMQALYSAALPYVYWGNYAAAGALVDELTALVEEKRAVLYRAGAVLNRGWILAVTGKAEEAVDTINTGLTMYRSTGSTVWSRFYMTYLARAYADIGRFEDAWRCVDEVMAAIETTKERWFEAEVNRVAGEIALLAAAPAAKAQAYFEHALAVARAQQAKSWELRAAMSLVRLWRDQGKREAASDLLAPVYTWFTEGFDTRDLKEAKALLNELAT